MSNIFYGIIFIYAVAIVVQLAFLFLFFFRKKYIRALSKSSTLPCSIIICAHNEAPQLERFLPKILQQQYTGKWEVIVVNDRSTDDSDKVLMALQNLHRHLKIITIAPNEIRTLPGKKFALQKGIDAAQYEHLLFTDADCMPVSAHWLEMMMNTSTQKDIVLGYGGYMTDQSILNQFIRWETVHTCMQYTSLAAIGATYMGVGRNMLYTKPLIASLKTDEHFQEIYKQTPSGDDDLTISKIAKNNNVGICLRPEAKTISLPKTTWHEWWIQKTRHVSTGKFYSTKAKFILSLYAMSHFMFWFCTWILLLLYTLNLLPQLLSAFTLSLFLMRLLPYWMNSWVWYRMLGEKKLFLFYPLGDCGWSLYHLFLSPYIFWKNSKLWR